MAVKIDSEEGIGQLTLAEPPLNILTRDALGALRAGLADLTASAGLRVILLSAEGKHFSAGASVEEHLPPDFRDMIPEFMETVAALLSCPVPLVAAVRGRCLGGGFEVAQAADLVLAAEGAHFGTPEIQLGVIPPAACAMLPGLATRGGTAELLFTGDALDAHAAARVGLVHEVVPSDELDARATALCRRIARHSAAALRCAKAAVLATRDAARRAAFRAAEDIYVDKLMSTADAEEGLRSFVEKRAPSWSHR